MNKKVTSLNFIIFLVLILITYSFINNITYEKDTSNEGIIIKTNKLEYIRSEKITITITNNLKDVIYSHIESGTPIFAIKYVERKICINNWEKLFAQCQYPNCIFDIDAPQMVNPGQTKALEWYPLLYIDGNSESIVADTGLYRIQILYLDSKMETWKTVNSNSFIIN